MNISKYVFVIIITSLFFIEMWSTTFSHPFFPNLLLIYFAYSLYFHKPVYQTILCMFGIELISFLKTGVTGLSSLILIPLALNFEDIKKLLYFKPLTPCICILMYEILFELIASWCTSTPYAFAHTCLRIIVNESWFLLACFMTPTTIE